MDVTGRTLLACIALALVSVSCSSSNGSTETIPTTQTSTTSPTTTTTTMATTTTIDGCDAAMADVFAFMSTFFDRVDVDPEGILANEDELGELFAESGKATGEGCLGSEDEALSALLIFLANEAVERERVTAAFIAGMLSSFCEGLTGYDLSLEARAACAAS